MSASQHGERPRKPCILVVTPEITGLPSGMGPMAPHITAKAGGLADVSASLVAALFDLGADVHVALPHYRRLFDLDVGKMFSDELRLYKSRLPNERIHLAEDRAFYYRDSIYSPHGDDNPRVAMTFQREVINNIIPSVKPQLIHCHDWTTGLIPAAARRLDIPCLFTAHNIHSCEVTLAEIEDCGIDAADFWQYLYYTSMPSTYEATRSTVPVDLLTSGVFAAHFINTVSPTFLMEIVDGRHHFVPPQLRGEFTNKAVAGCGLGILNAPDPGYNPTIDRFLPACYGPADHPAGKRENKLRLQERLGLRVDAEAPLFFWPSRLDPVQKGCGLLAGILLDLMADYASEGLQVGIVADGPDRGVFQALALRPECRGRVGLSAFDEGLSHQGYAAADFLLMPSRFEPCGLSQMIGTIYGTLPVAHATGGIRDTIRHLQPAESTGNGFLFKFYDEPGLRWAVDEAMAFYALPGEERAGQISRVMREGLGSFNHSVTAASYIEVYERMLARPLINTI